MKRIAACVMAMAFLLAPAVWADLADEVSVSNVVVKDGRATGVLVNRTGLIVRNPRILIRHSWLWADEFEPGADSPGRSEVVTIPAEIPPGESLEFSHEFPTTEASGRRGRFQTSAEVVGFEQIGESISSRH
jgi:hypothetical protein